MSKINDLINVFKTAFGKYIGQATGDDFAERRDELKEIATWIDNSGGYADDIWDAIHEGEKALADGRANDAYQIVAAVKTSGRETPEGIADNWKKAVAAKKIEVLKAKSTAENEIGKLLPAAREHVRETLGNISSPDRADGMLAEGDGRGAVTLLGVIEAEYFTLTESAKAYHGATVTAQEIDRRMGELEKRNESTGAGVDFSKERENLLTAGSMAERGDYDGAASLLKSIDKECGKFANEIAVFETGKKFKTLEEPIGEGKWAVKAVMDYSPPGALDIPGTGFSDICPGQDHVNKSIVEQKLAGGLPGTPVIPAAISPEGKICLLDKHHTFVACVALGRSVKIALTGVPTLGGKKDWSECTWSKFKKKKHAAKGFGLSPTDSEKLEGERVPAPDWKSVVPWRKDKPPEDDSDESATAEETTNALKNVEEGLDKLEEQTAEEFHKLLGDALAVGPIKEHFENLLGGEGFKIKFDPEAENAFYEGTTIVLPTRDKKKEKRSADDLLDALIFESCNLEVKDEFEDLDDKFREKGTSLADYGQEKAGKEASLTVLKSAKMVYQMRANGGTIAEQGQRNIDAILELDPGFFKEVVGDGTGEKEKGGEISKREQILIKKLQEKVCSTQHQSDLDPVNNGEHLKKPQWLKSGEMYHYEKARDMSGADLVTLILKRVNKVAEGDWNNRVEFEGWLSTNAAKFKNEKERARRPLLFCKLLDAVKVAFKDVDFSGLEFNGDMMKVAVANGGAIVLDPAPEITTIAPIEAAGDRMNVYFEKYLKLGEVLKTKKDDKPTSQKINGLLSLADTQNEKGNIEAAIEILEKALLTYG